MRNVLKLVEIILTFKTESADTVHLAIAIIITRIAVAIKCDNHLSECSFPFSESHDCLTSLLVPAGGVYKKEHELNTVFFFLFKTAIFLVQLTLI